MKAVIFAAGRGSRLGIYGAHTPKILLRVGARTLLERHVGHLEALGIDEIHLVVGYKRQLVESAIARLSPTLGLEIRTVHNRHFEAGSLLSMDCALRSLGETHEPTLLLDGDVLYCRTILERLLDARAETVLAVDRNYDSSDDDPVLVPVRAGRPVDFRKAWSGEADWIGESVGVFRVGADDLDLLAATTRSLLESGGRELPYEEAIRSLVTHGRFSCVDITNLPWIEIDFPDDLTRARETIAERVDFADAE